MEVRLSGRAMEARAEQPQKARLPMEVRLAERSMEMSEEQQTKALLPMETRLSGQATETREERRRTRSPASASCLRAAPRAHRGDDDLPATHVQSLGGAGRRRGAAWRRR